MKAFFAKSAVALTLAAGTLVTAAESASAFSLIETPGLVRPGIRPARPIDPIYGRGPVRDTMYRYPRHYPGYYPGYYPGMVWGGSQIFSRPIYIGAYRQCGWVKVYSPWGPRWKPVCVRT